MKQANREPYDILYARLSQEDEREGESNSIQNQRMILEQYASEKGFTNPYFLYDDGFSGTNFNRPGWNSAMRLIESGMVRTLIVKDLSRLGREYLEVGKLTELVFPSYGVRFIAINDNVDSFYGENDFVPFKSSSILLRRSTVSNFPSARSSASCAPCIHFTTFPDFLP